MEGLDPGVGACGREGCLVLGLAYGSLPDGPLSPVAGEGSDPDQSRQGTAMGQMLDTRTD